MKIFTSEDKKIEFSYFDNEEDGLLFKAYNPETNQIIEMETADGICDEVYKYWDVDIHTSHLIIPEPEPEFTFQDFDIPEDQIKIHFGFDQVDGKRRYRYYARGIQSHQVCEASNAINFSRKIFKLFKYNISPGKIISACKKSEAYNKADKSYNKLRASRNNIVLSAYLDGSTGIKIYQITRGVKNLIAMSSVALSDKIKARWDMLIEPDTIEKVKVTEQTPILASKKATESDISGILTFVPPPPKEDEDLYPKPPPHIPTIDTMLAFEALPCKRIK